MPDEHSRLGPSASERWLSCPASLRMTEALGLERDRPGPYAEEGTNAHTLAEITTRRLLFNEGTTQEYDAWKALVTLEQADEMRKYTAQYSLFVKQSMEAIPDSVVLLEQRVHPGVPECWGTADAVIVSPTLIHVIDFKYGRGVPVDAEDNPQLKLYGLGALEEFGELLGEVETVRISIFQPRIDHNSTWEISAKELRRWRDEDVIPLAEEALTDDAHFGPSEEACRFCPAAGECSARANLILEEFANIPVPTAIDDQDFMSPEYLAHALSMLKQIRNWCNDVEETALRKAYSESVDIPGWKVVMSGGRRQVTDDHHAVQTLIDAGYTAEQVAKLKLRTLGELEKLMGRDKLQDILDGQLVRSEGKPSMVPESDKRPAASPEARVKEMFDDASDLV